MQPDKITFDPAKDIEDSISKNTKVEKEWEEISSEDILKVLGQTIKKDDFNKLLVFLCQLLAYSESSQINLSFNAPSASGKSYLALEIADLFPKKDVLKLGYASPTSFFHTTSEYSKEKNGYVVNLERKIVVFLDMPHSLLLQHLRPLLSHDEKEILVKITDKSAKGGIRTKDIFIRGYPAVLFCSANFNLDEQELTRFILLSPETNQEKIREAIYERVKKEADREGYFKLLNENPERQALKQRIIDVRDSLVNEIDLGNPEKLLQMFYERNKILKPRHSRDIQRIASLAKAFAMLNLWTRERVGDAIKTNEKDLENAFKIWDEISVAQDLGVSPYILNLYKEVIVPIYEAKGKAGLSRQEVLKKHFEVYGRHIADWQLRQEIIPMMKTSGLVSEEQDPMDKRKLLIYPLVQLTTSGAQEIVSQRGEEGTTDDQIEDIFGVKFI
jgi:hypothetical protein